MTKKANFCEILKCKQQPRTNMGGILARMFNYSNTKDIWENIYVQKLKVLEIPTIKELNYDIFNNIENGTLKI